MYPYSTAPESWHADEEEDTFAVHVLPREKSFVLYWRCLKF